MGLLSRFNPVKLIEEFKLEIYAETGTGICECLNFARQFPFKNLYSVDLDPELIEKARWIESVDPRVKLFNNYSTEALPEMLDLIRDLPTLFFLDGHFPESDFKKKPYGDSIQEYGRQALPLEDELNIIVSRKDIKNSVIIIDDWHIMDSSLMTEHRLNGNEFKERKIAEELGINLSPDYIMDLLTPTHEVSIFPWDQGFLLATPRK